MTLQLPRYKTNVGGVDIERVGGVKTIPPPLPPPYCSFTFYIRHEFVERHCKAEDEHQRVDSR